MVSIYVKDGCLCFNGVNLASVDDYLSSDRSIGSVFESLSVGEQVLLKEGKFVLDEDLDPQPI